MGRRSRRAAVGRFSKEFREGQKRMTEMNRRMFNGPVSQLPVPDTDNADRITPAELEESS